MWRPRIKYPAPNLLGLLPLPSLSFRVFLLNISICLLRNLRMRITAGSIGLLRNESVYVCSWSLQLPKQICHVWVMSHANWTLAGSSHSPVAPSLSRWTLISPFCHSESCADIFVGFPTYGPALGLYFWELVLTFVVWMRDSTKAPPLQKCYLQIIVFVRCRHVWHGGMT